jgi:hypothetical protein
MHINTKTNFKLILKKNPTKKIIHTKEKENSIEYPLMIELFKKYLRFLFIIEIKKYGDIKITNMKIRKLKNMFI